MNCNDQINAIRSFLSLIGKVKAILKPFCVCKLFEYILSDKCENVIYSDRYKKFRDTILIKMNEFDNQRIICKNMKYIELSNTIRKRFSSMH